jgi:hypothetical protein
MWFESAVAHHLQSLLARPDRLLPSHTQLRPSKITNHITLGRNASILLAPPRGYWAGISIPNVAT